MKTRILRSFLISAAAGMAITLISGLIQTPMAHLGVDVVYRGVPLFWMMRVIPTRFDSIDWLNFAADFVFWTIAASIVAIAYLRTKGTQ